MLPLVDANDFAVAFLFFGKKLRENLVNPQKVRNFAPL